MANKLKSTPKVRGPNGGARPGAGKKHTLTQEIADRMVSLVQAGNYIETAAAACGVPIDTVRDWLRHGARGTGPASVVELHARLMKAEAESEVVMLARIKQHAQKDWRADAWRAERRFGQRWRQTQAIETTGKDGGPIEVESKVEVTRYKYVAPKNPIVDGDD